LGEGRGSGRITLEVSNYRAKEEETTNHTNDTKEGREAEPWMKNVAPLHDDKPLAGNGL
jgi:hypothetical protein